MEEKDYLDSSADLDSEEKTEEITEENAVDQTPSEETAEESYDTTISGIGVKYENNDNWQFEAEARTLSGEFLEKAVDDFDDADISMGKENVDGIAGVVELQYPSGNSNQIVINRSSLIFVPVAIFVAVCIVLVSFFSVRYFTVPNGKEGKYANPGSIVAEIGDTKVTTGMFNYYYSSVIKYYEQYASYGYYKLDTSQDLNTQYTTDADGNEISWANFFIEEVFKEIKRTAGVYGKATEAGITVTPAQQSTINEQIESMKASASEAGQSLNQYIESLYGEYCTEDTIRLMLEQYYVSVNYSGYVNSQPQPSDEEIDKYYSEHENEFKQISFSYLALTYDTTSKDSKESSIKKANSYMDKITDRDSIIKMIPTAYKDYIEADAEQIMASDDSLTKKEAIKSATENYESTVDYTTTAADTPLDEETTNWLFDDSTKIGEKKCYVNEESGYIYVVLKTEKASADKTETYSVRHILVTPEDENSKTNTDTNGTKEYTDEQWAAAEKKANEILDTYNKGDKTEYSFALLSEEHSGDVASTSASGTAGAFGGLCAATPLGKMVPEFEEWSVDKSRKYGDTGIVKSQYGYHIMFFVNNTESYRANVISAMRTAQVDEIINGAFEEVKNSRIDRAIKRYNESKANQNKAATPNTAQSDNTISAE